MQMRPDAYFFASQARYRFSPLQRSVMPFHFKVDTNSHQESRVTELETNHLYQSFREIVLAQLDNWLVRKPYYGQSTALQSLLLR